MSYEEANAHVETSEELAIIVADCVKDNPEAHLAFKVLYERIMNLEKLYIEDK